MIQPSLAGEIRCAIAAGDFRRGLPLWLEYAGILAGRAEHGELEESLLADLAQLIEWTKTTALMMRTHAAEEIAQRRAAFHIAQAYSESAAGQP